MVMKRNAMRKNLRQSIFRSFGRYIAIVAIIALGAGLFTGLLLTKADMVATGQVFTDQQNMFDLRLVCSYGWTQEYVETFARMEGVQDAEGLIYLDLIARTGENADDAVYRFYSLPETVNQVALRGGRMPQAADECLADGLHGGENVLGKTVVISENNDQDSLDAVRYKHFTIVGYVASPLYMDMNRGTTTVGSGSLTNYYYIPAQAFDVDYYTEIHITIPGDYEIYTEEYNDALDAAADAIKPEAERLSQARYQDIRDEAEEAYQDGYQEYLDGVKEFEEGKAEAEQELADAYQELLDGEQELKDNRKKLVDGGNQIQEGREALEEASEQLEQSKQELAAAKAAAQAQFDGAEQELDAQYAQLKPAYDLAAAAVEQAQAYVAQLGEAIQADQTAANIAALEADISAKEAELAQAYAELEGETSEDAQSALQQKIDGLESEIRSLSAELLIENTKYAPYAAALAERNAIKEQCQPAIDGMNAVQAGYQELEAQKSAAQAQFAEAEAQIAEGEAQIAQGRKELDDAYDQLMVSWGLFHKGEQELADGWEEYEKGKLEAEQEIADAEAELEDARQELAEARADIDALEEPDLYILDRNSNVGYYNVDNNSDIVAGVSRVFPVFFLLVASLVCITTMTRMIDEERTQIGTLKALGYSNAAIIGKYLVYSGSGALLGCGVGIWVGSVVFPQIIWNAYCIMLYIQPKIVLTVDWPLCIAVVLVYTAVLLFVTWYCCRKALQEEPAELIRPKAPEAGKKVLLEYLPFWNKISFLNKVTIRNIFRYRQRLAMMLVGIGGCTALLLTGFGLRDSIVNVADYQFEEVTLYDMEVYFRNGVTQEGRAAFQNRIEDMVQDIMFCHQSSVELDYGNQVKEIYMIAADDQLTEFMDLHSGSESVSMPGGNEVVLSVGVAEAMGIRVGDTVVLRNGDLQQLELTVCGIFDNHVYNYSIVAPETLEAQWGQLPEQQMAYVKVREGQDAHSLGAVISDMNNVMNVSISADLADMVRNMMDALDLVVLLIVFCAGLLAVTVLYNLTNININERIREIATIKVLGFNASETAAYVFKENMTLTVAGSLIGLLLGKLLLSFVMSQIKIDMVWFKAAAEPVSYIWSIALTLVSALVVDFIFFFKLEKINMAEALKSVE